MENLNNKKLVDDIMVGEIYHNKDAAEMVAAAVRNDMPYEYNSYGISVLRGVGENAMLPQMMQVGIKPASKYCYRLPMTIYALFCTEEQYKVLASLCESEECVPLQYDEVNWSNLGEPVYFKWLDVLYIYNTSTKTWRYEVRRDSPYFPPRRR